MKLLLTSEGTDVFDEFIKILPKSPGETTILKVMTAAKAEDSMAYVAAETLELLKLGFKVQDIDIEDKTESQLREILPKYDVIYVGGGNTFYLLNAVKKSGFDTVIKDLLSTNKIYVGVSAGSILAAPTIEVAGWVNEWNDFDRNTVGIKDLEALGLIDFHVFVHFEEKHEEMIRKELSAKPLPLRILKDGQAFLIQDDKVELVGKENEVIIK